MINYLQMQQTPYPFAHVPSEVPPEFEHSSLKKSTYYHFLCLHPDFFSTIFYESLTKNSLTECSTFHFCLFLRTGHWGN